MNEAVSVVCVVSACFNIILFYSSWDMYRRHRDFRDETFRMARETQALTELLQARSIEILKANENVLDAMRYQRPYSMRN